MTAMTYAAGLPDPIHQPEFYEGVVSRRALAWIVDILIITGFTFLAGLLTLTLAFFLWPVAFVAIGAVYRIGTLASGSATWGMRLMGIELRDHRGERFDRVQSVLHVFGYYLSISFLLPALASIGAMLATERRQGLTDLVLGTAAINRPG
ncbi:RDD family protein [Jannaschia ovalis]|uniref:RDD family protein n=1 Tax=Jannaschia ovalis TaxID=3038773 RepID=A0ABY8LB09_9RHOB|nr:RDD family protein [Jannaschia sp. GRR-S6-38]WGH78518.1 RDD family protein [Jannaschia sp. GRR-S6-38]